MSITSSPLNTVTTFCACGLFAAGVDYMFRQPVNVQNPAKNLEADLYNDLRHLSLLFTTAVTGHLLAKMNGATRPTALAFAAVCLVFKAGKYLGNRKDPQGIASFCRQMDDFTRSAQLGIMTVYAIKVATLWK